MTKQCEGTPASSVGIEMHTPLEISRKNESHVWLQNCNIVGAIKILCYEGFQERLGRRG